MTWARASTGYRQVLHPLTAPCCCSSLMYTPLTEDSQHHAAGCSLLHTSTFYKRHPIPTVSLGVQRGHTYILWDLRTLLLYQADMSSPDSRVVGAPEGCTWRLMHADPGTHLARLGRRNGVPLGTESFYAGRWGQGAAGSAAAPAGARLPCARRCDR